MSGLLLYYLHFGYERRIKIKVYIMLAVVGFWMLVMTLTNILQCQPVTAAWASDGGAGKCIERNTLLQATAVTDAFLNVGVLALTFPGTWRTDWKPWNRGLVITLCYLQGLLVITCSILRAYYAFSYKPTEPFTTFGPYFLWSKIQEAFGIVTVCGWPAGAGLVAVVTCNYREPRASAWASLGKQIRRKMTDDGFGQLLGDSEERTRLESLSREQRQRGDVEALKWSDKIAKLREELDAEAERRTKADILGKPF